MNISLINMLLVLILANFGTMQNANYGGKGEQREIIFSTNGLNNNEEWWVTYDYASDFNGFSTRWWNDYKITNNYKHGSSSHNYGDPASGYGTGFEAPDNWDKSHPVVAYGYYKFTYHCPENSTVNGKYFYLDLRDGDWETHYSPSNGDLYIEFNLNSNNFKSHNDQKNYTFNNSDILLIWELFNRPNSNKDVFQPTSPKNFHCTNKSNWDKHPYFAWLKPSQPTGVTFKYFIHRSANNGPFYRVASNLTSREWTGNSVIMTKNSMPYECAIRILCDSKRVASSRIKAI